MERRGSKGSWSSDLTQLNVEDLRREMERQKDREFVIKSLMAVGNRLRAYLKQDDVFLAIRNTLTRITGVSQFSIFLREKGSNMLTYATSNGVDAERIQSASITVGEGVAGKVADSGIAYFCGTSPLDQLSNESGGPANFCGLPLLACVPLRGARNIFGIFNIHGYNKKHDGEDLEPIRLMVDQASSALDNVLTHAELKEYAERVRATNVDLERVRRNLERHMSHLNTLSLISVELHSVLDIPDIYETLKRLAFNFLDVETFHVFYITPDTHSRYSGSVIGKSGFESNPEAYEKFKNIVAHSMRVQKAFAQKVTSNEELPAEQRPEPQSSYVVMNVEACPEGIECPVACFPLIVEGNSVGAIVVEALVPPKTGLTNRDIELLALLAQHAAIAIVTGQLYQQVEEMAITDSLTGLYDRRHFTEIFEQEMKMVRRYDVQLSVIISDIDNFKKINDTYGHLTGDEVLKRIADEFRANVRDVDLVARYGGEEFVVLAPRTDRAAAASLAERLRKAVESLSFGEGRVPDTVTVSLGTASYVPGMAADELLKRADDALYRAKANGKNVVFQDPGT